MSVYEKTCLLTLCIYYIEIQIWLLYTHAHTLNDVYVKIHKVKYTYKYYIKKYSMHTHKF